MNGSRGPTPPPAGLSPLSSPKDLNDPEGALRALYVWSAQTRNSVALWRREESQFLWPLLGFVLALTIGSPLIAAVVFEFVVSQGFNSSTSPFFAFPEGLPFVFPVAAGLILWRFLRHRNRQLDRPSELRVEPPPSLPANLIEASLLELDATDAALTSIHARIWWIVFLTGILSISAGLFFGAVTFQVYLAINGFTADPLTSIALPYGVGLGFAGGLIALNALYWRRVEFRLWELEAGSKSRRAALTKFELGLWERV